MDPPAGSGPAAAKKSAPTCRPRLASAPARTFAADPRQGDNSRDPRVTWDPESVKQRASRATREGERERLQQERDDALLETVSVTAAAMAEHGVCLSDSGAGANEDSQSADANTPRPGYVKRLRVDSSEGRVRPSTPREVLQVKLEENLEQAQLDGEFVPERAQQGGGSDSVSGLGRTAIKQEDSSVEKDPLDSLDDDTFENMLNDLDSMINEKQVSQPQVAPSAAQASQTPQAPQASEASQASAAPGASSSQASGSTRPTGKPVTPRDVERQTGEKVAWASTSWYYSGWDKRKESNQRENVDRGQGKATTNVWQDDAIEGGRRGEEPFRPGSQRHGVAGGGNIRWNVVFHKLKGMHWRTHQDFLERFPNDQKPWRELNDPLRQQQEITKSLQNAGLLTDTGEKAPGATLDKGKNKGKGKKGAGKDKGKGKKGKGKKGKSD